MELLILEVRGAAKYGPSGQLVAALHRPGAKVVMYDATFLAREVSPELALHFSRIQVKPGVTHHVLEYVTVRFSSEYIPANLAALEQWIEENGGVRHEMQVRSAIDFLRKSVSNLKDQAAKTRASRHLRLIDKELISN